MWLWGEVMGGIRGRRRGRARRDLNIFSFFSSPPLCFVLFCGGWLRRLRLVKLWLYGVW